MTLQTGGYLLLRRQGRASHSTALENCFAPVSDGASQNLSKVDRSWSLQNPCVAEFPAHGWPARVTQHLRWMMPREIQKPGRSCPPAKDEELFRREMRVQSAPCAAEPSVWKESPVSCCALARLLQKPPESLPPTSDKAPRREAHSH